MLRSPPISQPISVQAALLALLLTPAPARAAPVADDGSFELVLTDAELAPVYHVANTLASRARCLTGKPDHAAANTFARAATMLDVAARHYPTRTAPRSDPTAHARRRLLLVDEAIQLYVDAYACAPGHTQRHHLESALELADVARLLALNVDHLPPEAPELATLATRRAALLAQVPPPSSPPPAIDLPPRKRPDPQPALEAVGEEPRFHRRFVLRPELGFGTGTVTNQIDDQPALDTMESPSPTNQTSHFTGIYANLVAAARFPLGAREVHAFTLGGTVGIQQVAPLPAFEYHSTFRSIVQGGLHLEFALYAHPRWLSFHPMLDLGAQAYVGGTNFGRPYLAPALAMCLDRAIVCFTFRGSFPFARTSEAEAKIVVGQFGLAVDLMRIADRRHGR